MSFERRMLRFVAVSVLAVLAIQVLASGASAAPPLGYPKGKPYYGSSSQRTSRSVRHARSYARGIYRYSRDTDRIEPTVAKAESEEFGRNISKAQKDLATARTEAGNDAKTLDSLKSIEQHLAVAAKHHQMLHEECSKESVDGMVCMECCNNILLELDKAQAEQDALIRSMEMGMPSSGAAPAAHEHQ